MYKYLILCLTLSLCTFCSRQEAVPYQALVDAEYAGSPGALNKGTPTFRSLTEALSQVPEENDTPYLIYLRKGRYYEKISVDKPNVHLIGESRAETIISYDASGDTQGPDGQRYGTGGCFTLRITAPDFHAQDITIENSFDYPGNAALADDDPAKVRNPQAVALMTSGSSDRAEFYNCSIGGYQDTFFADAGRHYLSNCSILGHVDFIFGAGQVVFYDCVIVSRDRKHKNPTGYVTAPSTPITFPYGFLFVDSRFVKEGPEVAPGSVRLGRPWHPKADLTVSGSAVFITCFMDDHIGSQGYAKISSRDSTGTRIWFDLEPDSRFFEWNSHGPGALKSAARPTLDDRSAAYYSTANVLDGWMPSNH